MIFSENRCPSRIKSGTSFFGIMRLRERRAGRYTEAVAASLAKGRS